MIEVEVKGGGVVIAGLSMASKKIDRAVTEAVRKNLERGVAIAQQHAPVKTGELVNSITYTQNGHEGSFGPNPVTVKAVVMEKGSDPYIIRPKNAQALRFVVGGRVVFAKEVKHPGVQGFRYMEKAREAVEPQIKADVREAVRRALRRRG